MIKNKIILLIFILINIIIAINNFFVLGRSHGAPKESCYNLRPNHGSQIDTKSMIPFSFNITLLPFTNDEEFIQVEIYSNNEPKNNFRGFIAQARMANNTNKIVDGTFVPIDANETYSFNCNNNENFIGNNTWTHSNNNSKTKVSAFWFPSESSMNNEIVFIATIVIDKKHYISNIMSDQIPLIENNDSNQNSEEENEENAEENENFDQENLSENQDDDHKDNEENNDDDQEQPEPSNHVESIVSSAITLNNNYYTFIIISISSLLFYNIFKF